MSKINLIAIEQTSFGKIDYGFRPYDDNAIKAFEHYKSIKSKQSKPVDPRRKGWNREQLTEYCNILSSKGHEVDFTVCEVKEMQRNRTLEIGDIALSAKMPVFDDTELDFL